MSQNIQLRTAEGLTQYLRRMVQYEEARRREVNFSEERMFLVFQRGRGEQLVRRSVRVRVSGPHGKSRS